MEFSIILIYTIFTHNKTKFMLHKSRFLLLTAIITICIITLTSGISKSSSDRYGGGNDLVEQLYQQEIKRNTSLNDIEDGIEDFYKKRNDALEKYNIFSTYNNRYYTDAKNKANYIQNITTKQYALESINKSIANYNAKMTDWNTIITMLNANEKELVDLHHLLKINITLPIIENYQQKELPSTVDAKSANTDLLKIIEKIKAITK
jgi:hypothetical protein